MQGFHKSNTCLHPPYSTKDFDAQLRPVYHGFLPKVKLSSAQNQIQRQGDPICNYHMQLRHVLSTFASANEG